jgi:phosphoenolpyruvate carboxykinase (GTP)
LFVLCESTTQCPVLDPEWNNPQGVPISAILFGGRYVIPLMESYELH